MSIESALDIANMEKRLQHLNTLYVRFPRESLKRKIQWEAGLLHQAKWEQEMSQQVFKVINRDTGEETLFHDPLAAFKYYNQMQEGHGDFYVS